MTRRFEASEYRGPLPTASNRESYTYNRLGDRIEQKLVNGATVVSTFNAMGRPESTTAAQILSFLSPTTFEETWLKTDYLRSVAEY